MEDTMFDQMRGSVLTARAKCGVRSGQLAEAEVDLDDASSLLQPMSGMAFAAGVQHDLAQWWSVTAELRAAQGDAEGAAEAWREAVTISRHVASLPQVGDVHGKAAVAKMLQGLADALCVCGRTEDAAAATAERASILKAAGVPDAHGE